jgi:TolB protein
VRGRLLYSARDITTGRHFLSAQALGGNAPPVLLQEDGVQPVLRPDGQRLLFRNVRDDMRGIAAVDPGSGLLLQFSRFAEDSMPTWNPQGNRIAFASNREGDRIWRVYAKWAEVDGDTTMLSIGEAPAWHPTSDLIAFRGCDATGNNCGIWVMNGSGGDRAPLTTIQADNRPAWSPNGRYVVFMSDGRDGSMDVYRLDASNGQVLRLTDSPAIDGLPTVSPDGRLVAFVSNRDGSWKVWYVSIDGGAAAILTPINGDLDNWLDHGIQWVN